MAVSALARQLNVREWRLSRTHHGRHRVPSVAAATAGAAAGHASQTLPPLPCLACRFEGLVKEDKCHVRGVFKYSNGDRWVPAL